MPGNKYLALNAAGLQQEFGSKTTSADTPAAGDIPALSAGGKLDSTLLNAVNTSGGAPDAGKVVLLDSTGKLANTVLPPTVGPETASIIASEALSAGDLVNIWANAGVANARKADASTTGKEANGFVLAAVSSGAAATVYFDATNTQSSGLAPGLLVYLDPATAGKATTTPPTYTTGQVTQIVGRSLSATSYSFTPRDPTVRA